MLADPVSHLMFDRMQHFYPPFVGYLYLRRYTNLKRIKQQGLRSSDLEKLEVKNPLHRRCEVGLDVAL